MSRTENPLFDEMSAGAPSLQISIGRRADDWRLSLFGDLDMETTRYLHATFSRVAAQPGQDVLVDLKDTTFCDCAGLTALLDEQHRLGRDGVTLVIENPPRLVRRLLAITGLDEVLTVRP
jgi:anti-sigma B factor antagonist